MLRKNANVLDADRAHFALWVAAIFGMYGVGYPVGHTAVIGWFSKAVQLCGEPPR